MGIASSLTNNIQWSTLALSNLTYMFYMFLVDEQSHTFLTLIGDNLFSRKGLVADRQLGHINLATTLLDKLRQAVEVTSRTVVVDRDNRVRVFLHKSTHEIICTLLHLRVGTLYGIQLNTIAITTSIYR